MFSIFGMGVSLVSALVYLVVMIQRVLAGQSITALATFWDRDILEFFLIGTVLFGLGLVGEYVGRIYQQVRHRPRYLVQAVLEREPQSAWQTKRSSSPTTT
jgi:undecaprenyl-phosphate 4-deoxy-4-formamido-L-arabinose transferase